MKKKANFWGVAALCLPLLMVFSGCPVDPDANPNVPVTGVSLNKQTLSLAVGATETLTATVFPDNATNKNVTWSTSNSAVATVSTTGEVTAVAAGTATITVTTDDGGKTATCAVTVTTDGTDPVPVTGVNLDKTSLELTVGATETLTATVAPDDAANKNVIWSTSNSAAATVDTTGEVTAVAAGTATITVTTADGGETATCNVTVTAPVPVTSVSLNKTILSLAVGAKKTLFTTVKPNTASNKNVTWSTSNTAVATVGTIGEVTAMAEGIVTITATADGKTATCTVTVTATADNVFTTSQAVKDWLDSQQKNTAATPYNIALVCKLEDIDLKSTSDGKYFSLNLSQCTGASIDHSAFKRNTNLTSVDLSGCTSLTSFGSEDFEGCTSLTSVDLSGCTSLTSIGSYTFRNCSSLTSVDLSGCTSLTPIGSYVFDSCTSLTLVDLPNSLTSIGYSAFRNCSSLTSIDLSGCTSLTSIGDSAFINCTNLTLVDLPNSIISIGDHAFRNCSSLTSVDLSGCTSLTSIGNYVFGSCTSLTLVDLPNSLTSIGGSAFSDCTNLAIICRATNPPRLAGWIFSLPASITIKVPAESVGAYKGSSVWYNYSSLISAIE